MALLNYTTKIDPDRTAAEIHVMLVKAGASAVMTEYAGGAISALSFRIQTKYGEFGYRLPVNVAAVHALMRKHRVPGANSKGQPARVAWRILKDWLEAQLAIVQIGMVELPEIFLPYMKDRSGATLYESLAAGGFKQLTGPD